jgi:hypothetical protein
MYYSTINAVIHYKHQRYVLINGVTEEGKGIHQYATGFKELMGMPGTWKDAEDCVLGDFTIAQ